MTANGREVELKYAMDDPDAVRELVAADSVGGLRAGPWRTLQITDRYVDTIGRSLERAGLGARLREMDQHTALTLKSDPSDGRSASALHDRLELEGGANQKLEPAQWPPSDARSLLQETIGSEPLRIMFTIDQRRVERDLVDDAGTTLATLSVDEAHVRRPGRGRRSFTTLEIEAADADSGAAILSAVAAELEASGLLRPERRSKQQIANEMVGLPGTQVKPPRAPGITTYDSMAEAGRKVLGQHLLRMLVAETGVRRGEDVEAVHKMRVATRRMRAAWRVFDGAYEPKLQRRYIKELRVVARALGAVRDLDVQAERLGEYIGSLPSEATRENLEPLVAEWRKRRDDAHREVLALLDKSAYEKFVDDYREFVETPGAGTFGEPERVRDAAAGRIWRAYERLRAHDASLPYADAAALHQLRIDGKRARYTLEFFREVLPQTTSSLISELTVQQDHLGLFNDAQIAATMTREWLLATAANLPPETRRASAAYLAASEREQARLRRSFARLWRRVIGRSFRRRLALAISEI